MSGKQYLKEIRSKQQLKDDQINYLLADVEKNLEEYRNALEQNERQLSEARKILISAKQSYNNTVAENKKLKAYIVTLKEHIEKQQVQFIEKQKQNSHRYRKPIPKKYKKAILEEESKSEPEIEQEEEEESESDETEKNKEIKKASSKKRGVTRNNIFEYINQKDAKRYKQQKHSRGHPKSYR